MASTVQLVRTCASVLRASAGRGPTLSARTSPCPVTRLVQLSCPVRLASPTRHWVHTAHAALQETETLPAKHSSASPSPLSCLEPSTAQEACTPLPSVEPLASWGGAPWDGAALLVSATAALAVLRAEPAWSAVEAVAEGGGEDNFVEFLLIWAGLIGAYLFVAPPIILNYLRVRWYKRNMPETLFQFSLVFIFFPALLLWGPFVNFRALPREEV